jgi:hypothetical protein
MNKFLLSLSVLLPFSIVALVGLSGCGSGGSESDPAPTKAQFTKQAEKICEDAENELLEKARIYVAEHPGAEEEDMIAPVAVPGLEKEIAAIKALGVPKEGEAKVEAMLEGFEKAVANTRKNPQVVVASETDPFSAPDKIAEQYGFRVCANLP